MRRTVVTVLVTALATSLCWYIAGSLGRGVDGRGLIKQHELELSDVGLHISLEPPGGTVEPERVSVSFTNSGLQRGVFRLPSPFVANDADGFAPYPPHLALLVKVPKTGMERAFVFTNLRKPSGPGELVPLKPGQVRTQEYPLMLFYRWGPDSPLDGNFRECFEPGDTELEVRAEVFVVEKRGPRRIASDLQTIRCSYPEWLFRDAGEAEHIESGNRRPAPRQ